MARAEGVLLVNLATMAWATNAVLGRWLRADIGPVTLTALRFTVATVAFSLLARRQTFGAILGLCGVLGLISGGSLTFLLQLQFNPGDLILMASAVVWAFYSVFGWRVMRSRSPVAATALSNLLGLPILIAGAAAELTYIPLNLDLSTIDS
jgi:drug/metabolite transporter (DMT)-like permease